MSNASMPIFSFILHTVSEKKNFEYFFFENLPFIVLAHLRIGHTRITHSYLLNRKDQPYCFGCNTRFTVKHL